ncbi:TPA: hypothetical protein DEO28_00315 [Candidatus Dependentiae bacterium]|nr:MAG: hypothetical protein UR14_C0001G0080 [candidate division TM6 bacterium GW2011_GWE2_31_21]KKP54040.1 MAG: hypothetical protein UR43_C0001G0058 [candidate division TM6 bacterium GW2011_GWF2_33_332]HBS48378.1 hypothetical protein [Candidatus Dependentiae bacterium]HBZ72948.1 hypothetical protein [Candidatus Dependentiae bacterium]
MKIIIDGYNLLRNIYHKEKGKLEKQRDLFIRQLGIYRHKKGNDLIVVFDGGLFGHATREIRNGVVIIFSGQKLSADDWIFNYVQNNPNEELLLITYDRQLKDRCKRFGVDSLGVNEFYSILQDCLLGEVESDLKKDVSTGENIEKYEMDEHENFPRFNKLIDSEALDLLMSQTDLSHYRKDETENDNKKFKKSHSLSKKEKKVYKKLKKL